jgi:hypothetical protein
MPEISENNNAFFTTIFPKNLGEIISKNGDFFWYFSD